MIVSKCVETKINSIWKSQWVIPDSGETELRLTLWDFFLPLKLLLHLTTDISLCFRRYDPVALFKPWRESKTTKKTQTMPQQVFCNLCTYFSVCSKLIRRLETASSVTVPVFVSFSFLVHRLKTTVVSRFLFLTMIRIMHLRQQTILLELFFARLNVSATKKCAVLFCRSCFCFCLSVS